MLTSRGWRVSPAALFAAVLLAVTVLLFSHPAWDSSGDAAPVSRPVPTPTTDIGR